MSGQPSRTALAVLADAADAVLMPWRRRFHAWSVACGIPAHVTLLHPFVAASAVDDDLVARLRLLYAPFAPFAYDLARVESFPGVAWLAPEPAAPLLELMAVTHAAFRDHPPYGDPTLEPVPHCTVGGDTGDEVDEPGLAMMLEKLRAGLGPSLPIACRADGVTMLVEGVDGTWARGHMFPFGSA